MVVTRRKLDSTVFGNEAINHLVDKYEFESVLDIGCGEGLHSDYFMEVGKKVTALDYGESVYFKKNKKKITPIIADFNQHNFDEQYDCVWCCHVLEHQLNVNIFLKKINSVLKEGGIVAITVPPLKHDIVGGHVTLWNAGLLLYNLILAGFDCRHASIKQYGYNISVILKKRTIDVSSVLSYDCGDIQAITPYLPEKLEWKPNTRDTPFNGQIYELNWN
ncbi:class I SAM-dependent methyltransferase [Robertmurraya massiliosenegalensis]|uniref:class I SAM-dependent methyltransferase n=1 Tax=Robertmurraya massiliosenegalensis TaxID=1287657 RepID=UPI0002D7FB71|nr:class I SAM-dependent methyltransferase [Robertmurraya massiliosenegalensis]